METPQNGKRKKTDEIDNIDALIIGDGGDDSKDHDPI